MYAFACTKLILKKNLINLVSLHIIHPCQQNGAGAEHCQERQVLPSAQQTPIHCSEANIIDTKLSENPFSSNVYAQQSTKLDAKGKKLTLSVGRLRAAAPCPTHTYRVFSEWRCQSEVSPGLSIEGNTGQQDGGSLGHHSLPASRSGRRTSLLLPSAFLTHRTSTASVHSEKYVHAPRIGCVMLVKSLEPHLNRMSHSPEARDVNVDIVVAELPSVDRLVVDLDVLYLLPVEAGDLGHYAERLTFSPHPA